MMQAFFSFKGKYSERREPRQGKTVILSAERYFLFHVFRNNMAFGRQILAFGRKDLNVFLPL